MLGLELKEKQSRSNVGIGRVEGALMKCVLCGSVCKVPSEWESCILGIYGFGKGV